MRADRPRMFRIRREAHEVVKKVVAKTGMDYLDVVNNIITGALRVRFEQADTARADTAVTAHASDQAVGPCVTSPSS